MNRRGSRKELSIWLVEFEAWLDTICIQVLRKMIEQCVLPFGYPKMHLASQISESMWQMGSGDNFTTDISEKLHITKVKVAYRSGNKVTYIRQMFKHNEWCTSLDDMEETRSYLALQGWYNIDSAKVFNILSATNEWRSTCRAHQLCLWTIQDEPFIRPVSQLVYRLRTMQVCGMCRSIKSTSHRDASEDFGIRSFGQLLCAQIEEDWGPNVSGFVLRYDQNVLIDSIFIILRNGLLYYHQPFQNPTSVECLGLNCKIEYTNANQGIMPEAHNIWVKYTQSEENDLNNTFKVQIPSSSGLYFSWTPLNRILQFQERLPASNAISTFSRRCKKT